MSAQDDYEEAQRRIANAIETESGSLSLSGLVELRKLPPEISQTRQLHALWLDNTSVF